MRKNFASTLIARWSEVGDAPRLLERQAAGHSAFVAGLEAGIADAVAGRVHDADDVFDELLTELAALPVGPEGE